MSKFKFEYSKPEKIDLAVLGKQSDKNNENYHPFEISELQLYNPLYNHFFTMTPNNYNSISLKSKFFIENLCYVKNENKESISKNVFIKFSPLLDPYRYMIGKYDVNDSAIRTLPSLTSTNEEVHPKLLNHNNASYIDTFFCYLTSVVLDKHNIVHGLDYYGSYLGIQKKFRINVADDLEYLRQSDYFNEQIGKLFYIDDPENVFSPFTSLSNSRKNKEKLLLENDDILLECDELPEISSDIIDHATELETIYQKPSRSESSASINSDSSESDVNYSSDEDEDEDEEEEEDENTSEEESEEDSSEESEEEELFGFIHNFPIQMICMEKCDGTLDELFVNEEIDIENGASALMQVVLTLLIYQKMFKFTHNDLHTNNIMYVETNEPHLYYQYNNVQYKVPTYGKIYKIIDFGRAIFKINGKVLCSDSFSKEGDASSQYNCEPFFNKNKARLEPNKSFDLCRLACSLFDFIMDIDDEEDDLDDLQKTVKRWCLDDNGKNVLYKRNGQERYPSFKLYKMIARTVHDHTPENQLQYSIFKQFESTENHEKCMNIDSLPVYFK